MSNLVFPLALSGAIVDGSEATGDVVIDRAASGKMVASSYQSTPRYRYKVTQALLRSGVSPYEFQELQSFYARHRGQLDSFLVVDAEDYTVTDHGFGVGDNATTAFQLQRSRLGGIRDTLGGPWLASSKPRTNLVPRSEEFSNAAWVKEHVVVTADQALAPDGTLSADQLAPDGAVSTHYLESPVCAIASHTLCTFSIFAKVGPFGTSTSIALQEELSFAAGTFDLSAGTASGSGAVIYSCGNGWYRCALTFDPGASVGAQFKVYPGSIANASLGTTGRFDIWGAQVEEASAPTPYVKTVASAVTTNPAYWPLYADGFEPITDLNLVGGPLIYKDGVLKTLGTDYTLSNRGVVTFTSAPAAGAVLSFTGSWYRRCRFSNPGLSLDRIVNGVWRSAGIELESVP